MFRNSYLTSLNSLVTRWGERMYYTYNKYTVDIYDFNAWLTCFEDMTFDEWECLTESLTNLKAKQDIFYSYIQYRIEHQFDV